MDMGMVTVRKIKPLKATTLMLKTTQVNGDLLKRKVLKTNKQLLVGRIGNKSRRFREKLLEGSLAISRTVLYPQLARRKSQV
jgi:hypothetical protein